VINTLTVTGRLRSGVGPIRSWRPHGVEKKIERGLPSSQGLEGLVASKGETRTERVMAPWDVDRTSERTHALGTVAAGFESVRQAFAENFTASSELGAAFHVVQDGRSVVDLWGGTADVEANRAWTSGTIAMIFSGTKGLVATCLLILADRNLLDLEAPVARYWPEFGRRGKQRVLVRHVLSHTAGLPGIDVRLRTEQVLDPREMATHLAHQFPLHTPGLQVYYHALTYGWLCAELLRRIDGRTIGRFFAEEIAQPLGLDAWIGLPPEADSRVASLELASNWGTSPQLDRSRAASDAVLRSIYHNPDLFSRDSFPWNQREFRRAEIPAGNGIASARAVARLYGCLANRGTIGDVRLMSAQRADDSTRMLACGYEPYVNATIAFGAGFRLQLGSSPFGPTAVAFGHGGSGGSLHGAWPKHRVGFSYVTNGMRDDDTDVRAQRLLSALSACCEAQQQTEE
jgi:CubicO group peptidase (beta-lactamase class C family)